MGAWSPDSKTHVAAHGRRATSSATRSRVTVAGQPPCASSSWTPPATVKVLKEKLALQAGEVLDGTFMSVQALRAFIAEQIEDAKTDRASSSPCTSRPP